MIINENNKDNILKGTVKRGFNQTPQELKEKMINGLKNIKTTDQPSIEPLKQEMANSPKLRDAFNNLKRMK